MKEFVGFKHDILSLEKTFEKISNGIDINSKVNYKQMLVDIFKRNYKINQKQFAKFVIYVSLLITPLEEIVSYVYPPANIFVKLILSPLDEVFLIDRIIKIISLEIDSYEKYVEKNKYSETTLNEVEEISVKAEDLLNAIKEFSPLTKKESAQNYELVSNKMQRVREVSEYISYSTDTYKEVILNYLINNQRDKEYIKVNYKKLSSQCIFSSYFNEEDARRVIQNEMEMYIDSHPSKLDTYHLKSDVHMTGSYLKLNYPSQHKINIINKCCIVNVEITNDLLADTFLLIDTIEDIIINENISNIIILMGSLLIEIDKVDNYNVQIISSEISDVILIDQLEKEIKAKLSKYNKKLAMPSVIDTSNVFTEKNIELSVTTAIERLSLFENIENVTITHNELKHIIPFYNAQNKNEFIMELINQVNESSYTAKDVNLRLDNKVNLDNYLSNVKRQVAFETIMISDTIEGKFDFSHICEIMNKLYALQLTVSGASFLNLIAVINCGQGVFLEARIGKKISTKLIDSDAVLGTELEIKLEKIIKDELSNQAKAISVLLSK